MKKYKQNLMYLTILIITFIACLYFTPLNKNIEVKGIYLPGSRYSLKSSQINQSEVEVYKLNSLTDINANIGQIRTLVHIDGKRNFQYGCDINIKKAIELAANNGANIIKYICIFSDKKNKKLSSVQLLAYVFRDN